jgi:methionine biosynthesis protein MetW
MLNSKSYSDKAYSLRISSAKYSMSKLTTFNQILGMIPNQGKLLDIGCFDGFLLEMVKERYSSIEVYGVDASAEAVRICNEKGLNVRECDVENILPFPDNFFDTIVAVELIEHLADTDNFLNEVKRVLKRDGYLILATPNFFSLARRVMTFFGINPYLEASFSYPPDMAGHLRFYTHDLLKDFMTYSNFEVISSSSDVVHFSSDGKLFSIMLAKIFPKLGRGVIMKSRNIK